MPDNYEKRIVYRNVRFTKSQHDKLREDAEAMGMSLSDFIRKSVSGHRSAMEAKRRYEQRKPRNDAQPQPRQADSDPPQSG